MPFAARRRPVRRRGSAGQTAVEYLLTTLALLFIFTSLYGVLQNETRRLFRVAGISILTAYQVPPR